MLHRPVVAGLSLDSRFPIPLSACELDVLGRICVLVLPVPALCGACCFLGFQLTGDAAATWIARSR
jgi:hypothetical protein